MQAASVGVPLVGGMAIGIGIGPEIKKWYPTIKKPSWTPPPAVFPVAWTALYTAMGVAAHRVWAAGGGPLPLGLYGAQLALNFAWSPLFFKKHDLKAATIDITALGGVLAATIYQFNKVDKLAGQLMIPYLGWIGFATALTWNIWLNNPEEGQRGQRGSGAKLAAGAESAARSVGDAMANLGGAVAGAASNVGDAVAGVASDATAAAATPFLAEGGEKHFDEVPADVAKATAARSCAGNGAGSAGSSQKKDS